MNPKIGKERIYNSAFKDIGEVILWDVLSIKEEQEFELEFISTNSKHRQGIRLAIDVGDGYIEINGIKSKGMLLWEDTSPKKVHVKCVSSEGKISIYNIFDLGKERGGRRSLTDFAGMLIERTGNSIVYKCNDAGLQTNFDKLVFKIELL